MGVDIGVGVLGVGIGVCVCVCDVYNITPTFLCFSIRSS